MPGPGDFGKIYVTTALINAATSLVNGHLSRKQQEQIAAKNRELQISMEKNRQHFQLEINEQNTKAQRQLSIQNHEMRLLEQQSNFEKLCQQTEWNRFMNSWPLINVPSVIREEQILPDRTVSLRVIFAKSNDPVFAKAVYPQVEQGLRDFVDLYHNVFGSRNIIFYHNAFSGTVSGGAIDANIHYALKELPVIIIDTNVLVDEICVSLTMWGLGSTEQSHFTVFKIPYQIQAANGGIDIDYYKNLSYKILAYLKFVLGYAYDAYNLIQYNKAPLLPGVAAYEMEQSVKGCILGEPEIRSVIEQKYGEIYTMVIGKAEVCGKTSYAMLPESFKGSILHLLRMEYAESLKGYVSENKYVQYLNESVDAWCSLRSDASAEKFLSDILLKKRKIETFFGEEDRQYFERIKNLYIECGIEGKYGHLVSCVCRLISDDSKLNGKDHEKNDIIESPMNIKGVNCSKKKMLRF